MTHRTTLCTHATGADDAAAPSTEDKALFNALTGCADELLSQGEYDVYTYSYEKVCAFIPLCGYYSGFFCTNTTGGLGGWG